MEMTIDDALRCKYNTTFFFENFFPVWALWRDGNRIEGLRAKREQAKIFAEYDSGRNITGWSFGRQRGTTTALQVIALKEILCGRDVAYAGYRMDASKEFERYITGRVVPEIGERNMEILTSVMSPASHLGKIIPTTPTSINLRGRSLGMLLIDNTAHQSAAATQKMLNEVYPTIATRRDRGSRLIRVDTF